uniref:Matrix metalloproteinase n=1 Tax=Pinctada fucata TaxID=50426 RepID=A0A2Z6G1B4_PINFU|nr:matrix metalloproteinase [Pinctada fucata]
MDSKVLYILILSGILNVGYCGVIKDKTEDPNTLIDIDGYLEKYGYMESRPPFETEEEILNSDAYRKTAIRKFQSFAGLDATGILNDATIDAMRKPRCGVKDIQTPEEVAQADRPLNFYAPGYKWPSKTITWRASRPTRKLSEATQRYAFENAFKYWSDVTPLKFEYTYGEPDIDIQFAVRDHGDGRYNAFDGKGGVLAHAYYPTNGDTHFDDEESWVFRKNEGTDIETVAAHEFGHALGLGHSSEPKSLMAPFYQGFNPDFKLHEDDIRGIQSLYGTKDGEITTTHAPTTTSSGNDVTPVSPTVCNMKFDAMTLGPDGFTYVFRNKTVYRLNNTGVVATMLSRHVYPGAPRSPGAAVYMDNTKNTFIFKGRRIWRYTGFQLDADYPITITDSNYPTRIHAAIAFKSTGSTAQQIYLFNDNSFWEFNPNTNSIVPGFPLTISGFWRGIPAGIEAAIQWTDGDIYFFKGDKYRRFDADRRTLTKGYPKDKAPAWLGSVCGSAPK